MKICILSENSYPVSTGGVSEWCEYLVKGMPNHEFNILTISPTSKLKYKTPDNVKVQIVEMNRPVFLSDNIEKSIIQKIMSTLQPVLKAAPIDCTKMYEVLSTNNISAAELISSKANQSALLNYYNEHFSDRPFAPFFYSWTSLYYLLFRTLELVSDIPETEVYHALNSGYAGLLGSIGKVSTGTPLLINEHGLYLKERLFELEHSEVPRWLHGFYIDFFNSLVKTSYKYSDEVTSVCADHIEYQQEVYSRLKPKVIYNGIDPNRFEYAFKENRETINVGTVSRITPIKDQLTLIRSIPKVLEKNNAFFYIIGDVQDHEYYDECIELTVELGIDDHIEFTGFQNSSDWYPKLDVFVLPSLSEGFPLTLLEAMSSGTPCIATNVGGVPELLDNKFLIDKWDPSELASKINWLLEDTKTRRQIARKGRKMVEDQFSISKMVQNYDDIYEAIV